MKILTWNINGIRAGGRKTSLKHLLDSLGADVICLQETKITRDMMDEPTAMVEGYESYFSFSRKRTGYSGTANYCVTDTAPVKAEEGLSGRLSSQNHSAVLCYGDMEHFSEADLDALDAEGRCVITQHSIRLSDKDIKEVAIINVYVPRAGDRVDRMEFKLKFLSLLQSRAEALLSHGIHVIVLGDLNLTHTRLDNCDPESDADFTRKSSRIWMNNFLQKSEREVSLPQTDSHLSECSLPESEGGHFSDVYRHLNPTKEAAFTNWNTATEARKANYGRRLDYILIDAQLAKHVVSCDIMADFEGSDHCPVMVNLNCEPIPSTSMPQLCSKLMPEFKGQQQKLSSFFKKSVHKDTGLPPVNSISHEDGTQSTQNIISSQTRCVLQKSDSLPNVVVKRGSTGERQANAKKQKMEKESSSKQISLTSFFSKKSLSVGEKRALSKITSTASTPEAGNELCDIHKDTSGANSLSQSPVLACTSTFDSSIISVPATCVKGGGGPSSAGAESQDSTSSITSTAQVWKCLLGGPPPPPLCPGHKEPCVMKTVKKAGPNKNKQFYTCQRPDGAPGKPEFRCNFFQWVNEKKKKKI